MRKLRLLRASGVRLQISRRVNSRMKSRKDILGVEVQGEPWSPARTHSDVAQARRVGLGSRGARPREGPDWGGGGSPELPILHLDSELFPFIRVHVVPL